MKNTNLLKWNEAIKLHTKEKKLPMLATSSIIEVFDYEKTCKKSAEICAKKLKKLFLNMKKENPWQEEFDVYNTEEWRKIIDDFLKMEKWDINKQTLFDYLHIKLWNLWLINKRPYYGYFTNDPYNNGWYSISEKKVKKNVE